MTETDTETLPKIAAGALTAIVGHDGRIELWEHDDFVLALPATFPHAYVSAVANAYVLGAEHGESRGAASKAVELRRVLGL